MLSAAFMLLQMHTFSVLQKVHSPFGFIKLQRIEEPVCLNIHRLRLRMDFI